MTSSQPTQLQQGHVVFRVAWAVYTLIHLCIDLHRWVVDPIPFLFGLIAGVAAVSTLLRPSSLSRFIVLIVAWSAQKIYFLPFLPNHVFLTLCTHVIILLSLGWVIATYTYPRGRSPRLYDTFAPLIRVEVLVLYFFAVFHKLNTAFFDEAVSCGWALYQEIVRVFPVFPTGEPIPALTIYGTIGMEALIPILLVFRRTRLLGVGLGIGFHFLLALAPRPYVASFSTMMIAAYTLFLPPAFHDVLVSQVRSTALPEWLRASVRFLRHHFWKAAALTTVMAGSLLTAEVLLDGSPLRLLALELRTVGRIAYFGWAIAALVLFAVTWRSVRRRNDQRPALLFPRTSLFRPTVTPGFIVLLALLVNGFSPYLGLKTEMSFSMFSNLRTEGGLSNHLFMPALDSGNGYQRDLVAVLDGSAAWMVKFGQSERRLPFFEVQRRMSRSPSPRDWIRFERGGKIESIRYTESPGHDVFQKLPLWERKLLRFRPVTASDDTPMACGH